MPAIDLARLKTQTARLSEKFDQPEAFTRALHALLDLYTNRTIRATQVVRRMSLPTYHTPKPVLRQIESEFVPLANDRPPEALALTNALWKAGSLESRLLAARLLGMIPPAQAIPVLTRLPDWLSQSADEEVRQVLLNDALARLRCENPDALFILLEDWLKSPRSGVQIWGIQALIPLLKEPGFENLPAVFRILRPAVEAAGPSTQLELQTCLAALGRLSPTETLYFLRAILFDRPKPMLLRTLRRMLPAMPEELESGLKSMLHELGSKI